MLFQNLWSNGRTRKKARPQSGSTSTFVSSHCGRLCVHTKLSRSIKWITLPPVVDAQSKNIPLSRHLENLDTSAMPRRATHTGIAFYLGRIPHAAGHPPSTSTVPYSAAPNRERERLSRVLERIREFSCHARSTLVFIRRRQG